MVQQIMDLAEDTLRQTYQKWLKITNMPKGFERSTKIIRDGNSVTLRVDYQTEEGKPLDRFLNRGTRGHFIRPRNKLALSWIQNGTRLFSKGHFVRGIKGKFVMEKTLREFKSVFPRIVKERYRNG